jgi:hypothetical protein
MSNTYSPSPTVTRPSAARRVLAWSVDFALVLGGAYLLGVLAAHRIAEALTDLPGLAGLGGWNLLTEDGGATDRARQLARALWHEAAFIFIQSCVLLVVSTFLYHWTMLTFGGRTLGKKLLGLHITPFGARRAALRAAVTTTADVACFSLACCLLASGAFLAAFVVWVLAIAAFWANILPALFSSGRSLADQLAGTAVVRRKPPTGWAA